jgi:DNA-binding SARP family transcriptional activator
LQNYLSTSDAKSTLSYSQYNTLKKHYSKLQEEKLLREGTLEELIAAYKKNNNPKYKAKILARMKKLQTSEK